MTQNFDEDQIRDLKDDMEDDDYWYGKYLSDKEEEAIERWMEKREKDD